MDSILTSIKKLLGIAEGDIHFDDDIIIHINSVLAVLTQLGVGPSNGFVIEDDGALWVDFVAEHDDFEAIKSYMYLQVKLLFDPPINSSVIDSMYRRITEYEWRIVENVIVKDVTSGDVSNVDVEELIRDVLRRAKESGLFKGEDGYSPVRGKDYLTDKEIEELKFEIVDSVLFIDKEYIQADGKAYILTDYIPNSNTRITAKVYFNPGSSVKAIFGSMTSTSLNRFDFGNNSSSKYQLGFGTTYKASTMAELGEEFEMEMAHGVAYINGEEIARVDDSEWEGNAELAIFARNVNGTVGAIIASGGKIWWLKIYENDALIHDFVARKHLVDGFGLYDRITKKFYGNSASSGAFTGG